MNRDMSQVMESDDQAYYTIIQSSYRDVYTQ